MFENGSGSMIVVSMYALQCQLAAPPVDAI